MVDKDKIMNFVEKVIEKDSMILIKLFSDSEDWCPCDFDLKDRCNVSCKECWSKAIEDEGD